MVLFSLLASWPYQASGQASARSLPQRNDLPISAESFCKGMPTVVQASAKQNANEALSSLCQGTNPTQLLRDLITEPYNGGGTPTFKDRGDGLGREEFSGTRYVRFNVAFSMRIPGKRAVDLLLAEEALMRDPTYARGSRDSALSIQYDVLRPDLEQPLLKENEGDIAFRVLQRTLRTGGRRQFNNLTEHDLKLFRMFDNNFDFMVAVRSLNRDRSSQSETRALFNKAIVIRAAITDPNDKKSAIMMTILNFEVYDQQDQDDAVIRIFSNYITKDIQAIYNFHTKR